MEKPLDNLVKKGKKKLPLKCYVVSIFLSCS